MSADMNEKSKEKAKKILRCCLFPHPALLILLLPAAAAALVYAMLRLPETSPLRIAAYVLAFYTLTVWCLRIPQIVRSAKNIKRNNKYAVKWFGDPRLRVNVTLVCNLLWNGAYAAMQLGLGIYHRSPWYYSLAVYYASLATMRVSLAGYTLRHRPGERPELELKRYRACGWVFLVMNLALSGMSLYMIRDGGGTVHHEVITIAMAAYTFTTLTVAIVNIIRYRKYNSPAFSASKAISLASACVSMLTLENTMLGTFSGAEMSTDTRRLFLALSCAGVSILIIVMAVYMIRQGGRAKKEK